MSTKRMSINDRALGAILQSASPVPTQTQIVKRPQTGPGLMAEHLAKDSEALRENESLKEEIKQWEGTTVSRKINPTKIKASRWANRHEQSFSGPEFKAFKSEIENAGGNIQPIKVRPVPGELEVYEIVFGHRRHRACLELGLDVFALISPIDELTLFAEMDRENRQRADLRPYEQGMMYRRALDEGLYSSLRKLSEALDVSLANVSDVLVIANLPEVVLDAFPSRLDVQLRWAKLINDVLKAKPDQTLAAAVLICSERKSGVSISAKETLEQLIQPLTKLAPKSKELKVDGEKVATMKTQQGALTVSFIKNKLSEIQISKLEKFILEDLLAED